MGAFRGPSGGGLAEGRTLPPARGSLIAEVTRFTAWKPAVSGSLSRCCTSPGRDREIAPLLVVMVPPLLIPVEQTSVTSGSYVAVFPTELAGLNIDQLPSPSGYALKNSCAESCSCATTCQPGIPPSCRPLAFQVGHIIRHHDPSW